MYRAGSPLMAVDGGRRRFLHLALFIRDAAGLAITRSHDVPPQLAGGCLARPELSQRPAARQLLHDVFTPGRSDPS